MKNQILFILSFLFIINFVNGQNNDNFLDSKNKISADLLPVLWGNFLLTSDYNLHYERYLTKKYSVDIGASIIKPNIFLIKSRPTFVDSVGINGFGFTLQPKFHLKNKIGNGWEIGPELYFKQSKYTNKINNSSELLYKWRLTLKAEYNINIRGFTITPFFGMGVKFRNYKWIENENESSVNVNKIPNTLQKKFDIEMKDNFKFAMPLGFTVGIVF